MINRSSYTAGTAIGLGSGNVIQGNYLGVDVTGLSTFGGPSGFGVVVGSSDNTIGGTEPAARNVISGFDAGVKLLGGTGNRVMGNFIGTDVTGTQPLGNAGSGVAFLLWYGSFSAISGNRVGGTQPGAGNLIAYNGDGDWLDDEEQVFAGEPLLPGSNILFFHVPASAPVADRTHARFRFSSVGALSYDGLALDGEVEDYALAILPGNAPPDAIDDQASTDQDVSVAIDVLANDTDPDGNLDISTLALLSDIAVVSVNVLPANVPPVAKDDTATTNEDTPVNINVTVNDADPDGTLDVRSVILRMAPLNGWVAIDPETGEVTYAPHPDFIGTDTFRYTVSDGDGASDSAVVTIRVDPFNDPPLAVDDLAFTSEGVPVNIDVLANDTDGARRFVRLRRPATGRLHAR